MYLRRTGNSSHYNTPASQEWRKSSQKKAGYLPLLLVAFVIAGADAITTIYDLNKPGLRESGLFLNQFADILKSSHYWYAAFLPELAVLAAVLIVSTVVIRQLHLNQNYVFAALIIPVFVILNNISLGMN